MIAERRADVAASSQGGITGDKVRSWTGATRRRRQHRPRRLRPRESPELSFRLADATINSYETGSSTSDVSQSTSTETSLRGTRRREAGRASTRPTTPLTRQDPRATRRRRSRTARRSTSQEFDQLQGLAERANDTARRGRRTRSTPPSSQTDQASAIVDQRLQVLDEPEPAAGPAGPAEERRPHDDRLRRARRAPVDASRRSCSATLDRTIRVPNDITASSASTCWPSCRTRRAEARTMAKAKRAHVPLEADAATPPTSSAASPTAGWPSSTTEGKPHPHHAVTVAVVAALLPRPGRSSTAPTACRRGWR